jgi:hypothetical protein
LIYNGGVVKSERMQNFTTFLGLGMAPTSSHGAGCFNNRVKVKRRRAKAMSKKA